MKTIVYQSFREHDVPSWLRLCMASVRQWAERNGYEYRFIGDEIFDAVPDFYRAKTAWSKCLLSDLARLIYARGFLAAGYDRAVWVDADVFIMDQERFALPSGAGHYFCNEIWVEVPTKTGNHITYHLCDHINNAVTVMEKGNSFLDFYIECCTRIVDTAEHLAHNSVGTKFLTNLAGIVPLNRLMNVGMFNHAVIVDLLSSGQVLSRQYVDRAGHYIAAANLCLSSRGTPWFDLVLQDWHFERAMEILLSPESPFRREPGASC